MYRMTILAAALALLASACGGSDKDGSLPTTPPTSTSMVASGGFDSPMDAVSSPDGSTFYFSAHSSNAGDYPDSTAAIFKVASSGGTPEIMHVGEPLEDPTGLVMSCDGGTLYVADTAHRNGDLDADLDDGMAPIYTIAVDGGTLTPLATTGISEAAGLALAVDCETLYVTGFNDGGEPALFSVPTTGGSAREVKTGAPLESPSGVHIDRDNVAWVMDQLPSNGLGGALFAIRDDGSTELVIGDLQISEPAGVSLAAGGETAVIPTRDIESGAGQLITVSTTTGEMTVVETDMMEPAGIRTAKEAGVFAVVDADGDAIYRAE